jgi:hypothetical protein
MMEFINKFQLTNWYYLIDVGGALNITLSS